MVANALKRLKAVNDDIIAQGKTSKTMLHRKQTRWELEEPNRDCDQ